MNLDEQKVKVAAKKIDELCLHCEDHKLTCYVAVAQRAISALVKEGGKEEGSK